MPFGSYAFLVSSCPDLPSAYIIGYPSCMYYKYPQWANQPLACCGVIIANASATAWSRRSRVRAALARKMALNFDQHGSIGDKSGEYGGRY